jgi:glycosyltransferase involved in cell wall biosynthesis
MSSVLEMRSERVALLTPYSLAVPRHGGQIRASQIKLRLEELGADVSVFGVFPPNPVTSRTSGAEKGYVVDCGTAIAKLPDLADWFAGALLPERLECFSKLDRDLNDMAPTIIWLEQPWPWLAIKKIVSGWSKKPVIIYSAQNVEYKMKREILISQKQLTSDAEAEIQKMRAMEGDLVSNADLLVTVTASDLRELSQFNPKKTFILPNGVVRRTLDRTRAEEFRSHWLNNKRWATFVGSAHRPNAEGFWDCLGTNCAFLRPDEAIVVVGGVSGLMDSDRRFLDQGTLGQSRIAFRGMSDDRDLGALIIGASAVLLPITSGGGSNLKTAEAIASGVPVVTTSYALRGFEFASSLTNVFVANTISEFRRAIRKCFDHAHEFPIVPKDEVALREQVYWDRILLRLTSEVFKELR